MLKGKEIQAAHVFTSDKIHVALKKKPDSAGASVDNTHGREDEILDPGDGVLPSNGKERL